jgi:hypothetical protein
VANDDNKTPEAHMAMKQRMKGGPRNCITSLQVMVKATERHMWPTPRAEDSEQTGGHRGKADTLTSAPRLWPTPAARDWRSGKASQETLEGNARPLNEVVVARETFPTPMAGCGPNSHNQSNAPLREALGGQLNPTWVEWLMGWPLGWTDCGHSGTAGCLTVRCTWRAAYNAGLSDGEGQTGNHG